MVVNTLGRAVLLGKVVVDAPLSDPTDVGATR